MWEWLRFWKRFDPQSGPTPAIARPPALPRLGDYEFQLPRAKSVCYLPRSYQSSTRMARRVFQ